MIQNKVTHSSNFDLVCKKKDCLLITHASDHIRNFDWTKIGKATVFDGRNILEGIKLPDNIIYYSLGRNKE